MDCPPAEVFLFVSDPVNDVKWHHNVVAAEKTSEGPIGVGSTFHWDARFLGRRPTELVMRRFEPPRFAEMELEAGWMRATVSYLVEPEDGGTKVTRTVGVPVPRLLAFSSPLVRYFGGRSGEHHMQWLQAALEGRAPPDDDDHPGRSHGH